jgi:hypothetical protein
MQPHLFPHLFPPKFIHIYNSGKLCGTFFFYYHVNELYTPHATLEHQMQFQTITTL